MTKQELTESMAEFLGYEIEVIDGQDCIFVYDMHGNRNIKRLDKHFLSPDGLVAVWDKLDEYSTTERAQVEGNFLMKNTERVLGLIDIDRYTAFYEAVHAMKTKKEKVLND